jgi:hypothetical protein
LQALTTTDDCDYSIWKATKNKTTQCNPSIREAVQTWARSDKKGEQFCSKLKKDIHAYRNAT